MRARIRIAVLAGCLLGLLAVAPRAVAALSLQPVGDFDQPIFVISPPGDPRLFVVERPGYIQVLHDGARSQFLDIHTRTTTGGERGLLSMAFDPNYATNGLFYVYYTGDGVNAGGALGDIHIDEFHVSADPNAADPASRRTVWTFSHSAGNHNGGQLQFGPDGYLYITVGDNANGSNAQTLANPYGKLLRIDPHGVGEGAHGIPPDNPFTGSATPEIWAQGLRNPFRFSFDHATGDLLIADVGASTREEIDFSPASSGLGRGADYGWPICEGFLGYPDSCPATVAPILDYGHSPPCNAVIGGYVYHGNQIPELSGRYLYTDLCHPTIRSLVPALPLASDDRSEGIGGGLNSPVSFGQDSSCELYVTDAGSVEKIVSSTPPVAAPACQAPPVTPASTKKRKCKKRHHKKHRAAQAKKHKKKRCKKHKKKKRSAI